MTVSPLSIQMMLSAKVHGGVTAPATPPPMHIPDGFLSPVIAIIFWLLAAAVVAYALWRVNREFDERRVPLMGVLAAAIFAGQMLNFTVAGGTSGHLLGATLATILLGPWASIVVMTVVVGVQALLFQDGGLLVLGANIFNMAIVGSLVAYAAYHVIRRLLASRSWALYIAGFITAWLSIVIAALVAALQLALSGTSPANLAVPAMAGVHALIGIGEGLITIGALSFLVATRRDLVEQPTGAHSVQRGVVIVGLVIALLLAILSPLASSHPDGLEWVAEQQGFIERAQEPLYEIIPDYVMPGVSNEALATILAGIVGTVIVFGAALLTGRISRQRQEAR